MLTAIWDLKSSCHLATFVDRQESFSVKTHLNSVLSQCTRGKSSIAQKPEVHPKILSGKKLLKNVTLQILNFTLVSFEVFLPLKYFGIDFWFSHNTIYHVHTEMRQSLDIERNSYTKSPLNSSSTFRGDTKMVKLKMAAGSHIFGWTGTIFEQT